MPIFLLVPQVTFDTLTASIGAAIAGDRTLGGLCDWVEAEAPRWSICRSKG